MWAYLIIAAIWIVIITGWLIPVARQRLLGEVFMAIGLGIMYSMIVLGAMLWDSPDIMPLRYAGYALFAVGAAFIIPAFVGLSRKGKPESGWEPTTELIQSGVYRIVRDPLYLGSAVFALGLIFVFQTIAAAVMGVVSIACFIVASYKEIEFNVNKFGDAYRGYMHRVPMWNVFRHLKRLRRSKVEA